MEWPNFKRKEAEFVFLSDGAKVHRASSNPTRRADSSSDHLRDDLVSLWCMEVILAGNSEEGIAVTAIPTDGVNAIGFGLLLAPLGS